VLNSYFILWQTKIKSLKIKEECLMNKLTQIRKALEGNNDITIVGSRESNEIQKIEAGYWMHTVYFYVAPKTGIYSADKLQALLMALIPEVKPATKDDFRECNDEMDFGKLYFNEVIGTETVRREITDEVLFSPDSFVEGKQVIEFSKDLIRRILVKLFPDTQVAANALKGKNQYRISTHDLCEFSRLRSCP
jgi:hypothetical protein